MSDVQSQPEATPNTVTAGMLSIPLAQLILIAGILRLTMPGQVMPEALAGADLMERALAGEDIGSRHEAKKWVHAHASGRVQQEGERLIAGGLAVPLEQPGGPGFAIHQQNAFTVATAVTDALRQDDWIADRRMALLVAMLSRTRMMGFVCQLLEIGGEQVTLGNRAEAVAAATEPSGLRITPTIKTALDAVGFACMDRDQHGSGVGGM